MKTFAHRAKTVVSEREDRRKELDHLRGALKCNGYPEWILRDLKEENKSDSEKEGETLGETIETSVKEKLKSIPVMIPYVNVNVSVYSLKSPLSSADFTIYATGIGTLSYTVSSRLGRIQHLRTFLQL